MVFTSQEIVLYTILAFVIAIAFSLRRLYHLEITIAKLEKSIKTSINKKKKTKKKVTKRKKKR